MVVTTVVSVNVVNVLVPVIMVIFLLVVFVSVSILHFGHRVHSWSFAHGRHSSFELVIIVTVVA